MKIKLALLASLLISTIAGSAYADQTTAEYSVLDVEDGDTLLIEINAQSERVQLLGIDAPEDTGNAKFELDMKLTGLESDQLMALGHSATNHLRSLVAVGERVSVQADLENRDRYGRIPAVVLNEKGRPVAEDMVLDGYAIALPNAEMERAYAERIDRLERFSRKSGNGLWASHSQTMHDWYDRTR